MTKFESVRNKVFGNTDFITTERYFVSVTTLVTAIFLAILCVVHILVGLNLQPVYFVMGCSLTLFVLYYLVRFRNIVLLPKIIMTVVGLIMLDITWYVKYLSSGPVLLFILMFGALVIWVWEGRKLMLLLMFYFTNIAVLFYIDFHAPQALLKYPSTEARSIDIFVSMFMYSGLLVFLLFVVKKEFLKQKENAVTSDKLKSAFLANMSHEIRTPMNGILGFMELLKLSSPNEEAQKEYIDVVEKSGHRMLNIINDIIDISKVESGQMTVHRTETNIKELLDYIYTFFQPEAAAKDMKLYVLNNLLKDESIIFTDREKVYAIFINLVKNAIKYSDTGFIQIGCDMKNETNSIQFFVKDTGIGIPKAKQTEIFKHFVQADIANIMARQGAGLGLSITKAYVNMLGGDIWVDSIEGKGSTFYFTLPTSHVDVKSNEELILATNNINIVEAVFSN
ncbi:sensor histidine kinase [Labilibacter marinus]|uniref:sensor histidine kinase n=1 Tax=Labilibacter marinus TaxID=1477105 RepID=UPI0009FA2200|nr:ATP-binding protein [Labilibacter marinus]